MVLLVIVDVLKKEWGKLKDNYRKTKNKREKATRSGAGNKKALPTCNYFTELSFLYDSMSHRSVDSNIPSCIMSPCSNNTEDDNDNNSEISLSISSLGSPTNQSTTNGSTSILTNKQCVTNNDTPATSSKTKRRRCSNDESADLLLVKALDKHLNKENVEPPVENDDNRLFCLSLVPSLKMLSPRKNALARLKIQQLLFDIGFDE